MLDHTLKAYARISLWLRGKYLPLLSYFAQKLQQNLYYNPSEKARFHFVSAYEILLNKNTQSKELEQWCSHHLHGLALSH